MSLLKVITYFLSLVNIFGNNLQLSKIIESIYLENDSDSVCFIGFNNEILRYFIQNHSSIPVLIFTSLSGEYKDMNFSSILVVQFGDQNHPDTSELQQFIVKLRVRKFVVVLSNNLENLRVFFSFFRENKFARIFGVANNRTYAYLPFAENHIENILLDEPLPNSLKDLNGFIFRTTVERNIPRTFWYTTKQGERKIGGCFGQIFLAFLRRHNASYEEIIISNSSEVFMPGVVNATIENKIDISMNAYGPTKGLDTTYPVKYGRMLVMVPLNGYVDPNEYFSRPFSFTVWILIGLTLVYLILADVVLKLCTNAPVNLWKSFSQMFLGMIGLPREKPVKSANRLHAQVFVLAFVLVNIYVISFTSFLTVYIKVKQYETLQDLMDNNVKVMLADHVWGAIYKSGLYPAGFDKIVIPVDYSTYLAEMYSMRNTSFAYSVGADTCEFLIRLQSCFAKPLFHTTRNSLLEYNLGFLVAIHSPFKEILSNFIFQVMETGLINKWDIDVVSQARLSGFEQLNNVRRDNSSQESHVALTLRHLVFGWNCLLIGWALAMIAFICEKFKRVLKP